MGWPDLPTSLTLLTTSWDNAITPLQDCTGAIATARSYWNAGNDHMAIAATIDGLEDLNLAVDYMLCYIWMFTPKTCLCNILDQMQDEYGNGGVEVTMDTILSLMVGASPDQLEYFIGLVDAYRQSLWNRPFNAEFFAALARGFAEWE